MLEEQIGAWLVLTQMRPVDGARAPFDGLASSIGHAVGFVTKPMESLIEYLECDR